jgi:hypothetical protein
MTGLDPKSMTESPHWMLRFLAPTSKTSIVECASRTPFIHSGMALLCRASAAAVEAAANRKYFPQLITATERNSLAESHPRPFPRLTTDV